MDTLEEPEPEPLIFPPGCEPELEELTDEEEPEHLPPEAHPAGDLHAIAPKNGHAHSKSQMNGHDSDEGSGVLPRSPVPPVEDPEMGSEPELTLPPDPPEND